MPSVIFRKQERRDARMVSMTLLLSRSDLEQLLRVVFLLAEELQRQEATLPTVSSRERSTDLHLDNRQGEAA